MALRTDNSWELDEKALKKKLKEEKKKGGSNIEVIQTLSLV